MSSDLPATSSREVVDADQRDRLWPDIGLQSRIDTVRDYVEEHARVGNFYVNRNQIGAVVESQPFGGEGLSGTGSEGRRTALCRALRDRARHLHRHHRCRGQCIADGGARGLNLQTS